MLYENGLNLLMITGLWICEVQELLKRTWAGIYEHLPASSYTPAEHTCTSLIYTVPSFSKVPTSQLCFHMWGSYFRNDV